MFTFLCKALYSIQKPTDSIQQSIGSVSPKPKPTPWDLELSGSSQKPTDSIKQSVGSVSPKPKPTPWDLEFTGSSQKLTSSNWRPKPAGSYGGLGSTDSDQELAYELASSNQKSFDSSQQLTGSDRRPKPAGSYGGLGSTGSDSRLKPTGSAYDWTARVEFNQFELPSSFSVAIFLGKVPNDPKKWEVSPNHVGSYYAFVNSAAKSCGNCRNNTDTVVEAFVHLNQAIARHSRLESLEPEVVAPHLTDNLQWRVLKARTLDDCMTLISSDSLSRVVVKSNSSRSVRSRSLFIPHP